MRAAATRRREPLRARFERPLRTTFARPSRDRRKRRRLGPQSLLRPRARGEAPPRGDHPERGSVVVRAHVPRGGGAHHRAPPSPPRARDASAPRNARKIPRRLAARAQPQPPRRAPRRPPGHHAVPGAPGGGPERAPDAPRRDRLEASVPGDARRGREPITTRRRVVRGPPSAQTADPQRQRARSPPGRPRDVVSSTRDDRPVPKPGPDRAAERPGPVPARAQGGVVSRVRVARAPRGPGRGERARDARRRRKFLKVRLGPVRRRDAREPETAERLRKRPHAASRGSETQPGAHAPGREREPSERRARRRGVFGERVRRAGGVAAGEKPTRDASARRRRRTREAPTSARRGRGGRIHRRGGGGFSGFIGPRGGVFAVVRASGVGRSREPVASASFGPRGDAAPRERRV